MSLMFDSLRERERVRDRGTTVLFGVWLYA